MFKLNCRKCGVEFVPTAGQIKKRNYSCKACNRAFQTEWRRKQEVAGKPVRGKKPAPDWWEAYRTKYHADPANRAQRAANMRRYRVDPKLAPRHQARLAVRRAVEAGTLVKNPCQVCGAAKVQGHHSDYTKPLDVMWLCQTHHRQLHAKAESK